MIPDVEEIVSGIMNGTYSKEQAIELLNWHVEHGSYKSAEDCQIEQNSHEQQAIFDVQKMSEQSLTPDEYEEWLKIKSAFFSRRKNLREDIESIEKVI